LNFSIFVSFSFILWKTEKAVHWGVVGQNFKKVPVAHGPCGALRVNFQIFKILPPIQNCLKIFPPIQKKLKIFPP
jgi:hypothetical protein